MPEKHSENDRASTWLHPGQVQRLRTACYDDRFAPRLRRRNDAILTLAYDTGLRVGELVRLDVDHLDLDDAVVSLPSDSRDGTDGTDQSASETITLDPSHSLGTARLLKSYLDDRDVETTAIAFSRERDRLTPKAVRDIVTKAAELAGVRPHTPSGRGEPADVSPQTIRHSTAWRLLTVEDRSIADVQRRLRHTTRSTTKRLYSHFVSTTIDSASDDFESRLAGVDDTGPLANILDSVPDVLFVFDTDGQMRWWNDRLPEITGYSDADIATMHPLEFVPDDDTSRISTAIAQVVEHGSVETRESHLVTGSGCHIPYEFNGAPLTDDQGTVWGLVGTGRDITARTRAEQEAERQRERFDVFVDAVVDYAIFLLDTDGTIVSWNRGAERIKGYSESEIRGRHFSVLYPDDAVEEGLPEQLLEAAVASGHVEDEGWRVRKDGSTFWAHVTITPLFEDGTLRGFAKVTRDMTERRERNREIRRQRDELERVNRLNTIIRDVDQALVTASTRSEIEQAVCSRLARVDSFVAAWVGESRSCETPIVPRVHVGLDEETLDLIADGLSSDETEGWPSQRARHTHDVHVSRDLSTADAQDHSGDPLEALGCAGVIGIPIQHRETLYGVLVVYTADSTPVGDRQRRVLGELGETIGHAIVGTERKAALVADSVVELTLEVRDARQFFVQVAERLGAAVTLEGIASRTSDSYLEYYAVRGGSETALQQVANTLDAVEQHRVIAHRDRGCLCEVTVSHASIPDVVAEYGGTLTAMTAEAGSGSVRIELPQPGEASHVVDALDERVDTVELRRKRTIDRPIRTDHRFRSTVDDSLTERQRETLEAAYYAGFFEHPRLSTGEDVAASLGIAPSTFHQHVRVGLQKLLTALVETPPEAGESVSPD